MLQVHEQPDFLICKECGLCCKTKMSLPAHVFGVHKIKFEDYFIKHYLNGVVPTCTTCGARTKYKRGKYTFGKYCVAHKKDAQADWSKQNGYGVKQKAGWKKGLTKETNASIKQQSEKMMGSKNPFFGMKHPQHIIDQISEKRAAKTRITFEEYEKRKSSKNHVCLSEYKDYVHSVNRNLNYRCLKCGSHYVASLLWHDCPICNPVSSQPEEEICKLLDDNNISYIKNTREIIKPQEIDIFIEGKRLAIEYNGLFWHSEGKRPDVNYHLNKTKACREKNINLVHIFSDEWQNKKEIVQSMLLNRLGKTQNKIHARKCSVHETNKQSDLEGFFNATHLSGQVQYKKAFYLKYNDEVVCALSLRSPFHKKYNNMIEIARFSSSLNTVVVGGFAKLLKLAREWAKQEGYSGILSYADLRFGAGEVYSKNGFVLSGQTPIDYWYTNGKERYNRFQYRAKDGKPEKQIALESNVQRVYGCGSNIYILFVL